MFVSAPEELEGQIQVSWGTWSLNTNCGELYKQIKQRNSGGGEKAEF